jgi:hypothetical protein
MIVFYFKICGEIIGWLLRMSEFIQIFLHWINWDFLFSLRLFILRTVLFERITFVNRGMCVLTWSDWERIHKILVAIAIYRAENRTLICCTWFRSPEHWISACSATRNRGRGVLSRGVKGTGPRGLSLVCLQASSLGTKFALPLRVSLLDWSWNWRHSATPYPPGSGNWTSMYR